MSREAAFEPGLLTMQFNARLQEKWSVADAPETEWKTVSRAKKAIGMLRLQDAASVPERDSIAKFIEGWSAGTFAVALSESAV